MNTSLLVMSCDSYSDLWQPFYKLFKKHWKNCPYKLYICYETKKCSQAKTINKTGEWTKRLREALEEIDTEYVILLLDDYFIRKPVNQSLIDFCINNFDDETATFDFQNVLADKLDWFNTRSRKGQFVARRNNRMYLTNTQPSIWNRKKLIDLCQEDMSIWAWETQILNSPYKHYINVGDEIIDIGYYKDRKPWGVVQNKWTKEVLDMFDREDIKADLNRRGYYDMTLSIITPYYKTLNETKQLAKILEPQLTNEVEWIIIDDGCDEKELDKLKAKVIHQENGGVSNARNKGLDNKSGRFVTFVDSDDMVTSDYVSKILDKIHTSKFDYCFFSWRYSDRDVTITDMPPIWNTSIWNCIYSSDIMGDKRFNETKQIAEDTDFNNRVRKGIKENLIDVLYQYNTDTPDSLTKRFSRGEITETRNGVIKTQLIVYRSFLSKLGGIESALYNFCLSLKDKYDIVFMYDEVGEGNLQQLYRLKKLVKCEKYNKQDLICKTFIYYGVNPQTIEETLTADKVIQQICNNMAEIPSGFRPSPKTTDFYADSQASADAFTRKYKIDCGVLHNLFVTDEQKRVLSLMSATRLAPEKGYDLMKIFAKRMTELGYMFTWEVFTNDVPNEEIDGFVFRKPRLNVTDYMWNKDYGLQFSTSESWGNTPTEFLERGVPVICTKWSSVEEQVEDGVNGFLLEKNLKNIDSVIHNMFSKNLKGFNYKPKYSIKEWTDAIGDLDKPKLDYVYDINSTTGFETRVLKDCFYSVENKQCKVGDILVIETEARLEFLEKLGYVKRIGEII